jgi:hypothetical protein
MGSEECVDKAQLQDRLWKGDVFGELPGRRACRGGRLLAIGVRGDCLAGFGERWFRRRRTVRYRTYVETQFLYTITATLVGRVRQKNPCPTKLRFSFRIARSVRSRLNLRPRGWMRRAKRCMRIAIWPNYAENRRALHPWSRDEQRPSRSQLLPRPFLRSQLKRESPPPAMAEFLKASTGTKAHKGNQGNHSCRMDSSAIPIGGQLASSSVQLKN